jgi:hypothetical protein
MNRIAAYLFVVLMVLVSLFQLGLIAGMPWGYLAMGGAYPGVYPLEMRVAAAFQIVVYLGLALIVLSRAGVVQRIERFSRRMIWVVVALSALSLLMNLATPSPLERLLWSPVAALMLITSLIVARHS